MMYKNIKAFKKNFTNPKLLNGRVHYLHKKYNSIHLHQYSLIFSPILSLKSDSFLQINPKPDSSKSHY